MSVSCFLFAENTFCLDFDRRNGENVIFEIRYEEESFFVFAIEIYIVEVEADPTEPEPPLHPGESIEFISLIIIVIIIR